MPDNFLANVMAMCCGLSLAVALGWNVTAGADDWRQLAEDLCIIGTTDQKSATDRVCQLAAARGAGQPANLVMLVP